MDVELVFVVVVLSGMDLECGFSYKVLVESVKKGLISEKDIDVFVKWLLKVCFELGEMDDFDKVEWIKIFYFVVCLVEYDFLLLDIVCKLMMLLLNKNNILLLKCGG